MLRSLIVAGFLACIAPVGAMAQQDADTRGGTEGVRGAIPDFEPANNTAGGATTLDFNGRTTAVGILQLTVNDNDYVRFTAAANEFYAVFTVPLSSLPNGFTNPDTIVDVSGPSGFLTSNDDAGHAFPTSAVRRGSAIRFATASAGTYTIRVSQFTAASVGRYALLVAKLNSFEYTEEVGNTFELSATVANQIAGPLVGLAVTAAGDFDYYGIDMNPGDVLVAATTSVDSTTNLNSTNMDIRLFAPDQSTVLVTSFSDAGALSPPGGTFDSSSTSPFITARANQAGRHFVQVTPSSGVTGGEYRIVTWVIPGTFCAGDSDGSGVVNFADVTSVLLNFGNSCP